ncbi:hypothetical protein JL722_9880 [Aureococcus anophagefferens]|nr:hypothetical protein JL722_9880 [Aureococcus anophagefferens]
MRSMRIGLVLQLVAAARAATVEVDASGEATATKLRIGLEWFLNPDHMPFVVADKLGFFREQNLEVELVAPADHWEAEKEILAGRLDVAVTETLHLAQDGAGKPILGGIERPRDMCGKTITYPGSPGPGGPAIVDTMVKADGGDCGGEAYGKFNGGFDHVGALAAGHADVATLIFANFEIPAAEAAGKDARYFALKDWGVPDRARLLPARAHDDAGALRGAEAGAPAARPRAPPRRRRLAARRFGDGAHGEADPESPPATLHATLPMFPNDASMAPAYFDGLMGWLVETGQVAADTAVDPAPTGRTRRSLNGTAPFANRRPTTKRWSA